jgi:hypothetical protein
MLADLKSAVETIKTVVYIGLGLGTFTGAALAAAWWGVRKRNKQNSELMDKLHVELTDKQNGSFRGEFTRFKAELFERLDDQRMAQDERLTGIERRITQGDQRSDERFRSIEQRLGDVEDRQEALERQQTK